MCRLNHRNGHCVGCACVSCAKCLLGFAIPLFLINLFIAFICIHTFESSCTSEVRNHRCFYGAIIIIIWMKLEFFFPVYVFFYSYDSELALSKTYIHNHIFCHYLFAYFGSHSAFCQLTLPFVVTSL